VLSKECQFAILLPNTHNGKNVFKIPVKITLSQQCRVWWQN